MAFYMLLGSTNQLTDCVYYNKYLLNPKNDDRPKADNN